MKTSGQLHSPGYERKKKWYLKNRDKAHKTNLTCHYLRKYGITYEEYERKNKEQYGLCAICDKPETTLRKDGTPFSLVVDHSHDDNKVRSLLCANCNMLLGHAKDDTELLSKAIDYLKKNKPI